MHLSKRPITRLPYPRSSQSRYLAVALLYWLLGWLLAPACRRTVTLSELTSARILVLKPCCLGDVVFATPLIRELRRALPAAHLTFAVGPHSRPAVARHPAIDRLLDTGAVGSGRYTPWEFFTLARRVRAERFDACFVLERSALLALLPLVAGVPIRIGLDSGGRGFSLNVAVPVKPSRPESELYLDLFRALGGNPASGKLEYRPSEEAATRVDRLVEARLPSDRPFVVLHRAGGANPGLVLTRKRWPTASFRELATRILEAGATVVLVGAPEDREGAEGLTTLPSPSEMARGESDSPRHLRAIGEGQGVRPPAPVLDLVGQLSLDELAALARRAAVYVGNDSGPSHLAEAAGANVVMLFGPSDPIVYGPRARNAVALTAGFWCSPCFENGRVAPCANVLCMPSLSVDRVWNEVSRFLAGPERAT
ncbi:MAG: glycosyltransferase family 9 protein [Chloroflexota bacterium]